MRFAGLFLRVWIAVLIFIAPSSGQDALRLIDSARAYRFSNAEKVAAFAGQAYNLAKTTHDTPCIAESASLLGVANYMNGHRDLALAWYLEAEKLYTIKKDTPGLVNIYNDKCVFYLKEKKIPAAMNVINTAISMAAGINNVDKLATACNNKGLVFLDDHRYDSAINCFNIAYTNYKKLNNDIGMSYSLGYLSSAFSESQQPVKALQCLRESLALSVKMGDKFAEAIGINNIGELLLQEHKPDEAIPYFNEALKKTQAINYHDLEYNAYNMLAQCYQQMGNFKKAFEAITEANKVHEKIITEKQLKTIEELHTRYETGKKEQENKLLTEKTLLQATQLSRNRIISYAIAAIAILAIGILYLFYTRYRLKQKARFREEFINHEKLRAHAMVAAEENERQRLARELHDGIGQTLAATRRKIQSLREVAPEASAISDSVALIDDSIKEVRQLSHNMMPPWLSNRSLRQAVSELERTTRDTTGITVHSEWADTEKLQLDNMQVLMLYRCMQEMIANIIKHARATTVNIEVVNHDTELSIMIYDNGIGFNAEEVLTNGVGIGLKNMRSRVEYIGGQLQIDSYPGKGTTYLIHLPLNTQS